MKRRVWHLIFLAVLVAVGALAWKYYQWIYAPNTSADPADPVVLIHNGTPFDTLTTRLLQQGILINEKSFRWVAHRMKFGTQNIHDGRYRIDTGLSNYDLIHKLRLGEQEPMDLIIRSAHDITALTGKIAGQLAMDSLRLIDYINTEFIPKTDYTPETVLTSFIPNTYEVYWNMTPEELMQRMQREYDTFWAPRQAFADSLKLSREEVYTLASIVERETQAMEERPTIAGVYLNRIKRNMLLQADPTVLFALGDYTIRRVLIKHLTIDSPYNTYKYPGLPPGPITMPSISSLDAVLQPEQHDYLFFCAMPGRVGYHAFASTLSGHMRNARAYQRWLDAEGIRR